MMTRKLLSLALIFPLFLFFSCGNDDPEVFDGILIGGSVTKIKIDAPVISETTETTAVFTSNVEALDGNLPVSEHGHVWSSVNTEPTTDDRKTEFGALTETISIVSEVTELVPNTTYFVRAYVVTDQGTGYSNQTTVFVTGAAASDVLVINEGNFLSADASLTLYKSLTGEVNLSAYAAANGFPVGATIQNVISHGGSYYMVTNSPDNLEILNSTTLETQGLISGFENPISFAAVGDKGYVSNWGDIGTAFGPNPDSYISIIDLTSNTVTSTIDLAVRPQELLAFGDKVYVANEGGSSIGVIDTNTDEISFISTAFGPSNLVLDANDHIWALCAGGSLVEVDPATDAVIQTINGVEVGGFDEKMSIDSEGNTIFFLAQGAFPSTESKVFEFEITDTTAPATALIDGENFYGVGVHPDGSIYVGNSNGFLSNGTVLIHDAEGMELSSFGTGIGPNGFVFR